MKNKILIILSFFALQISNEVFRAVASTLENQEITVFNPRELINISSPLTDEERRFLNYTSCASEVLSRDFMQNKNVLHFRSLDDLQMLKDSHGSERFFRKTDSDSVVFILDSATTTTIDELADKGWSQKLQNSTSRNLREVLTDLLDVLKIVSQDTLQRQTAEALSILKIARRERTPEKKADFKLCESALLSNSTVDINATDVLGCKNYEKKFYFSENGESMGRLLREVPSVTFYNHIIIGNLGLHGLHSPSRLYSVPTLEIHSSGNLIVVSGSIEIKGHSFVETQEDLLLLGETTFTYEGGRMDIHNHLAMLGFAMRQYESGRRMVRVPNVPIVKLLFERVVSRNFTLKSFIAERTGIQEVELMSEAETGRFQ